jgi:hypothetical protein
MSDRLWQTSGIKSRVTEYHQHLVSSDEWQTMTNIDFTPNIGYSLSLVTWPPMLVISCHSSLDTQCWWYSVTRDLIPDVCHNLSLMTWHPMLVVVYKTMTNIRCQVTSDRLWPTFSVKWRVTDWPTSGVTSQVTYYDQHWVRRIIICHSWPDTRCFS